MTDYEIYLRAAEHVAESDCDLFSCIVVSNISAQNGGLRRGVARMQYEEMFLLRGYNRYALWRFCHEERRNLRVMLLCMAAAVEKVGGL